jgi:hypothetical protein
MPRILTVLISILIWSCGQLQPPKILSPEEKIQILPYQDILTIQSEKPDTMEGLNSFLELDSLWVMGTGNEV